MIRDKSRLTDTVAFPTLCEIIVCLRQVAAILLATSSHGAVKLTI